MRRYRILSLDGGGTWALLQVMALQKLYGETARGHDVLKKFHLVAAKSGGSITLGGLIENKTLDELLAGYFLDEHQRRKIFVDASFWKDPGNVSLQHLLGVGAKYDAAAKLAGLEELLPQYGGVQVAEVPARLRESAGASPDFLICAFDYDRRRATFFRSNWRSRAASAARPPAASLAEAIHASTNAPVNYFDEPAAVADRRFWDGAISGYNNPILAAVVEALANGCAPGEIQALSIGTGTVFLPLARDAPNADPNLVQPLESSNIKHDLGELASSILDDPPDAASFIAHVALGQRLPGADDPPPVSGSLIRMSPMIQPLRAAETAPWTPPKEFTAAEFDTLAHLDMDAVDPKKVDYVVRLGKAWLSDDVPNQPIRMNGTTMACEIGHARFGLAKTAWDALAASGGGQDDDTGPMV